VYLAAMIKAETCLAIFVGTCRDTIESTMRAFKGGRLSA
jgi:hypothetical protein